MSSTVEQPSTPRPAPDSRKRRISEVLSALDSSKFTPSKSPTISDAIFAPWDRSQLVQRLSTFRGYHNHSLNSPISAYALARRGYTWINTESCIQCSHCRQRLVINIETKVPNAYKALEDRYAEMSVARHRESCPWREKECQVRLLRLALADPDESMTELKKRRESYESDGATAELPSVRGIEHELNAFDLTEIYAMHGWSLEKLNTLTLLVCKDCHRRARLIVSEPFDVLAQHQAYCPWICAETQGPAPGWQLLQQHYNNAKNKKLVNVRSDAGHGVQITQVRGETGGSNQGADIDNPRDRVRQVKQKLGFSNRR